MKAKNNKSNIIKDTLNAAKAAERKAEIESYGKTICHSQVVRSKKVYTRKSKHKVNYEF